MSRISVVNFNYVKNEQRLDAEYYTPEVLNAMSIINRCEHLLIKDIYSELVHPREFQRQYSKEGVLLIRAQNCRPVFLELYDKVFIPRHIAQMIGEDARVRDKDILLVRSGANFGDVAIVPENLNAYGCADVLILRVRNVINPFYVGIYLNTKYGKILLKRSGIGSAQPHLYTNGVLKIPIPVLPKDFQLHIERLVKHAYEKRKIAEQKYQQAEELLYSLLGISKEEIEKLEAEKAYETNFKEVRDAFRFDAEYYHPRYLGILESLKKIPFEVKPLKEVVKISHETIDPTKEPYRTKKFKYVPIARINESGEIFEWEEFYGWRAPSRARMIIRKGDILIPSLSGTFDKIALVPEELDGQLATTGCFVVRAEEGYPEFLFLLFRSPLFKRQLERLTTGAIMSAVPKTTFGNLLMPKIPKNKQEEIASLVKEYFKLRKESRELIQKAIRDVEEAIENASSTN